VPQQPKPAPESGRPAAERQFVDREEPIAIFQAALKEPQPTRPLVLVFHGGAGTGKSRLRRELVRQLAGDPNPRADIEATKARNTRNEWVQEATSPFHSVFVSSWQSVLGSGPNVITATLDFDVPVHRQPDAALLSLRKAIGETCKAGFPSFDLGYAVYWQKSHPDAPLGDDLKLLLEPSSLLSQLLDDSGKLPLIGLVPKISSLLAGSLDPLNPRPLDPSLRSWWECRGERELEDLPQMEPGAIVESLPKLWAADVKDYLQSGSPESRVQSPEVGPRNAVLFIDSYEKLRAAGDGGRETEDRRQKTDAWVRELVKQLPEALWVISGRQKLRWEEVEKEWVDVLSQHELGALPERSARQFLASCGITDEPIQEAIAKGSQGLPHYLNLAVDTFLEIKQSGQRVPA